MNHIQLGQAGERYAVEHLTKFGYEIIDRNYRWKHSEIDIVCKKDNLLIIVEVKTRNSEYFGKPFESVSISKQKRIVQVTNEYIREKQIEDEIRFDIISIVLNNTRMELEHIESAFYPLV